MADNNPFISFEYDYVLVEHTLLATQKNKLAIQLKTVKTVNGMRRYNAFVMKKDARDLTLYQDVKAVFCIKTWDDGYAFITMTDQHFIRSGTKVAERWFQDKSIWIREANGKWRIADSTKEINVILTTENKMLQFKPAVREYTEYSDTEIGINMAIIQNGNTVGNWFFTAPNWAAFCECMNINMPTYGAIMLASLQGRPCS